MGQSCDEGSIHVHDSSKMLVETYLDMSVFKNGEEHKGKSGLKRKRMHERLQSGLS